MLDISKDRATWGILLLILSANVISKLQYFNFSILFEWKNLSISFFYTSRWYGYKLPNYARMKLVKSMEALVQACR